MDSSECCITNKIENRNQWEIGFSREQMNHLVTTRQKSTKNTCFCGPGRKRYLIAFLCCACLTVVIGMRSEMLGIITNLNNTNNRVSLGFRHGFIGHSQPGELFKHQKDENLDSLSISPEDEISMEGSLSHSEELHNDPHQVNEISRYSTSLIFKPSEHRKMPWTEAIQNDIVENAVFFAYLITSPIGGYLTVNYDSSFLLGGSVAITCGMNLFLPLVETIGNNINAKLVMIILLRLIQGLAEGCLIPAVFGILRFWSPENERSTLVCLAVIGVSLGPLIGLPVCAEIEKKWGWGVVFYIYANLGLIWCIFWWRLIDEKPNKDKKLGKRELNFLKSTIPNRILYTQGYTKIPWQKIFTSRPVYAILFTYAADDWTFQISSVCMQSFYRQMYDVDVERTIFFLSFPFLSRSMFVPIGGIFADFLRINTSLSRTTIRKMFAGLGFGLKGIFFIALGYAPSEIYATMLLSLALGFSGLAVAGYAVNVIDLAPNFSGLVMGFANSVSTFTGILSTFIASIVVSKFGLELKSGWRVALCLAACSQFGAMITYLIFGSSEQQPWAYSTPTDNADNDYHTRSDDDDEMDNSLD
ncbi:unnamed protein product [Trichobilharzia szidati]|nr:unnamed protein product [Trichobilharzia szidati]CAH8839185.1 unnamed protein product [Trichobilharzia szidati]